MNQDDMFGGPVEADVSLEAQIVEVEREIALREHCYAGWVANGSMKQAKADRQAGHDLAGRDLLAMRAVLRTLRQTPAMLEFLRATASGHWPECGANHMPTRACTCGAEKAALILKGAGDF